MEPVTCEKCHHVPMHPIWASEPEQIFRGWWCPECNHFVDPVGREKKFVPEDWQELKRKLEKENGR